MGEYKVFHMWWRGGQRGRKWDLGTVGGAKKDSSHLFFLKLNTTLHVPAAPKITTFMNLHISVVFLLLFTSSSLSYSHWRKTMMFDWWHVSCKGADEFLTDYSLYSYKIHRRVGWVGKKRKKEMDRKLTKRKNRCKTDSIMLFYV